MGAVYRGVELPSHPGYVAGRYYGRSVGTGSGTILSTENRLYFVPVFLPRPAKIDRISASVSTGAGDAQYQVRIGAYRNAGGRPSTLLFDAGVVAQGTATGACQATVDQTLVDWVWLCIIGNRNAGATGTQATFRGYASESRTHLQDLIGATTNDAFVTGSDVSAYHDQTVGSWGAYTLPATAPTLTFAATVGPMLTFRAA